MEIAERNGIQIISCIPVQRCAFVNQVGHPQSHRKIPKCQKLRSSEKWQNVPTIIFSIQEHTVICFFQLFTLCVFARSSLLAKSVSSHTVAASLMQNYSTSGHHFLIPYFITKLSFVFFLSFSCLGYKTIEVTCASHIPCWISKNG